MGITVATMVSDWPTGYLTGFWAEHSMMSGIISGLVLLIFTSAVIERWLAHREEQQAVNISEAGFRELGNQLLRQWRLLVQLSGGQDFDHTTNAPLTVSGHEIPQLAG